MTLTMMNFTTPTTILRSILSRTTRNDRPPASAIGVEVRQYMRATESALHFECAHYENVGKIKPVTQYGSVVANSLRLEWHQRLLTSYIAALGYRYHLERERPRAAGEPVNQLGSDAVYLTVRWRFGEGIWTAPLHEVYGFAEHYKSNLPSKASFIGVGGIYHL